MMVDDMACGYNRTYTQINLSAIRKNIDEMGKNTTTIIVAQRVSSVLDCDKIIVIDEGRIAACGNHDKLLKTCAIYARISSLQSGITL